MTLHGILLVTSPHPLTPTILANQQAKIKLDPAVGGYKNSTFFSLNDIVRDALILWDRNAKFTMD
jgi:hypothetical protein